MKTPTLSGWHQKNYGCAKGQLVTKKQVLQKPPKRRAGELDGFPLSLDGDCAKTSQCFSTVSKPRAKREWIAEHELYLSTTERVFIRSGETYMDAVTGTLYADGRCLTSDRLTLGTLTKDQAAAAEVLMEIKSAYRGSDV